MKRIKISVDRGRGWLRRGTRLKETPFIGFGWIFPKTAGKFRTVKVTVSEYIPPKIGWTGNLEERILRHKKEKGSIPATKQRLLWKSIDL